MGRMKEFANPRAIESAQAAFDALRRWHVPEADQSALEIFGRLDRTWRNWTEHQRTLLLEAAETVSAAERAKAAWNPKLDPSLQNALIKVCSLGTAASTLAEKLNAWSVDRDGEDREFARPLIRSLVTFASSAATTAMDSTPQGAAVDARRALSRFRKNTPKHGGRAEWTLLADLVWLCGGQPATRPDTKALQRYEKTDLRRTRNPVVRRVLALGNLVRDLSSATAWTRKGA